MLSGRRPFAGDTLSEILAGVARDDPDWSALPDSTPPPLRSLLRRCLRKPPRERLHDIADARLELEELFASGTGETRPPEAGKDRRVGHRRSFRQKWVWAVGGVLVGGLAAGLIFARPSGRPEAPAAVHLVQDTPEAFTLGSWGDMPAPSPDGRLVAFTGYLGDTRGLWIRPLDSAEARLVPGTTGANLAFWSPDGAWIAFFTDEDLNKVRLADGTVQRICSTPPKPVGGTWAEDGTIIFSAGYPVHRLFSAAAAGGEPRPLTSVDTSRGEAGHTWPQALPGGRRFLFNIDSTQGEVRGLYVASLDAPDSRRRLLPGASRIVYASGRLLFVRDGALLAQPFDTRRVAVSGEPRLVAPAEWAPDAQWARFGVSPGGVLAYFAGAGTSRVQLAWLDRRGHKLESVGKPGPYGQIALSPDGRRVALEMPNESGTNLWTMGGTDLWVMDLSRRVTSCVTCNPESEENPVWSPDSQELAFAVGNVPESLHIFHKVLRTGAPASHLLESPGLNFPECWSRDGRTLLYISGGAFWALSPTGERPPEVVLRAESPLAEPRLSPDGRWLAYISKESGDWEVYVQPFRRPGERVRVSTGGGGQPMWRDDGKELFYRKPAGPLLVVGVREEADSLELGPPTELFRAGVEIAPTATDYGVSSDGQRFLVKVPIEGGARDSLHVVVNWPSVLEGQR
jgi:Tol biopolymer transport system component